MRTRLHSFPSNPMSSTSKGEVHRSVLLRESVSALDIRPSDTVVDATLGGAGHARVIANHLNKKGTLIGFDLDSKAIERAKNVLCEATCHKLLIEGNFRSIKHLLKERGISRIDKALFDLGWSSFQLDAGRGFSFLKDEPLKMTYAEEVQPFAISATDIVNDWAESSIADILYGWGEERFSRRIAKAIVARRTKAPIVTTKDLVETIISAVPIAYAKGRLHPATRTFQALRIATNDELGAIEDGLNGAFDLLATGGRIAVITFHSIEDRVVKRLFRSLEDASVARRITKKPIVPTESEIRDNPRSRSSKLRVIEKL